VTDVEHIDSLLSLKDTIDHAVDVRLLSVQKMPDLLFLGGHRASVGMAFQCQIARSKP
jgi:hypothetical protein